MMIVWVDFIKWNGIEFDGIHSGVLANKKFLDKKIGEVKFKVADNVTNPSCEKERHNSFKNGLCLFIFMYGIN